MHALRSRATHEARGQAVSKPLLEFFAAGRPRPQGSKRAESRVGTSKAWMREQVDPDHVWRGIVAEAAWKAARACGLPGPIAVPVKLMSIFFLAKPTKPAFEDWPATRGCGDIEKLIRATNDALQQAAAGALVKAGVLIDDALVVQIAEGSGKYWARGGQQPGVWISLEEAELPQWYAEGKVFA